MDIKDKVAVVTGGASGLGRATVEAFVENGAKVMIFDRSEEQSQVVKDALGDAVDYALVDVTDEQAVIDGIQKTMDQFGAMHIVVNCAGIGSASKTFGSKGPMSLDIFKMIVDINLNGTFNVLRLAAEQFAKNDAEEKGVIINTASVAAFDGQIGQAAYSASKAGVVGMTLPIARDLGPRGIRVMTIAPGIFNTPLLALLPEDKRKPLEDMVQSPKRLGDPKEYAQLAVHIVENSYLNGETIRLDGAIRMQPK